MQRGNDMEIKWIKNILNRQFIHRWGIFHIHVPLPWGNMGVSINGGTPNAWFIRENPIQMDDGWGYPYFREPPYEHGNDMEMILGMKQWMKYGHETMDSPCKIA